MENSHNHVPFEKIRDSGSGKTVIVLQGSRENALVDQLSHQFRVVVLEVHAARDLASVTEAFAETVEQHSIRQFCLVAESDLAPAAIAQAIEAGDALEALILIAPRAMDMNGAAKDLPLEEIKAPTLVLFGTRDELIAPESGRIYARRIPNCFHTLVYDAGHDIASDRPQALHGLVRDFLEHREKFVFPHESSVLSQ
jgi:pimeloyl-ACP methyl ester carboxylesterase